MPIILIIFFFKFINIILKILIINSDKTTNVKTFTDKILILNNKYRNIIKQIILVILNILILTNLLICTSFLVLWIA